MRGDHVVWLRCRARSPGYHMWIIFANERAQWLCIVRSRSWSWKQRLKHWTITQDMLKRRTNKKKKNSDVVNGIESHTGCCPNLVRHCVGHLFSPLHLHMLKLGRMPFRLNCVGVQVASQTDHWRIYEYSCKGCMMQLGAIVFPLIEWFLCHVPPNLYS